IAGSDEIDGCRKTFVLSSTSFTVTTLIGHANVSHSDKDISQVVFNGLGRLVERIEPKSIPARLELDWETHQTLPNKGSLLHLSRVRNKSNVPFGAGPARARCYAEFQMKIGLSSRPQPKTEPLRLSLAYPQESMSHHFFDTPGSLKRIRYNSHPTGEN